MITCRNCPSRSCSGAHCPQSAYYTGVRVLGLFKLCEECTFGPVLKRVGDWSAEFDHHETDGDDVQERPSLPIPSRRHWARLVAKLVRHIDFDMSSSVFWEFLRLLIFPGDRFQRLFPHSSAVTPSPPDTRLPA